jgi:hypothetical protein
MLLVPMARCEVAKFRIKRRTCLRCESMERTKIVLSRAGRGWPEPAFGRWPGTRREINRLHSSGGFSVDVPRESKAEDVGMSWIGEGGRSGGAVMAG